MSKENIEKAKEAKSVEELLSLAKENNYPLTEEEAQNIFNQFHATGELSDDELDQVGGGCGGSKYEYTDEGHWIIPDPDHYSCSYYSRESIYKMSNTCKNCEFYAFSKSLGKAYCKRTIAIPKEEL